MYPGIAHIAARSGIAKGTTALLSLVSSVELSEDMHNNAHIAWNG